MPLITISQDFASGGFAIAKKVAEELNLHLYNDDRLKEKALEVGVKPENLPGIEEKIPGFFDRLLRKSPGIYLDVLQEVVYRVAEQGEGIIFGHGAQILLKDFECALHIRIFAPREKRIQNVILKKGVDGKHAEKLIRMKDDQQKGFFQYAFQGDNSDPALYDLIINTDKISWELATKLIVDLARSDEIKACSLTALATMRRMGLEKKIHASLLDAGITPNMIFIKVPEPGVVDLSGFADSEEERKLIVKISREMDGVSRVDAHIFLRSDIRA